MTGTQDPGTLPVPIHRWRDGSWAEVEDAIAEEVLLQIHLNGSIYGTLVCSPWALDELAVGYLYTDGVIDRYGDIAGLEVRDQAVWVQLREPSPEEAAPPPPPCRLDPPTVLRLARKLESCSRVFQNTGCVHSAILAEGERILACCEDVGRHNALDRLIGHCLIQGIPLAGRTVVFSGRLPEEIVGKVVRVGCSAIISVSAPTSMAVDLAREAGLMLVGFARGNRFNVYTHPELLLPETGEGGA